MLIDSHCHLSDQQFHDDRSEVLLRARQAGVEKILTVASNRRDAEGILEYVNQVSGSSEGPGAGSEEEGGLDGEESPGLWGTAGVHPHDAGGAGAGDLDRIREILRGSPRMVAVGETGLDFYYDNAPREDQERLFRGHLEMAEELDLPVVVHSRSADALTGTILREWQGRVRGVLHCFTGGAELLHVALAAGWMVSFTGLVTFKNFQGAQELRSVPRDRLMVETDAPYLAPVPHRGRRNEPAYVTRVAQEVAALRGEPLEEVAEYTSANATRFFGLIS